MDARSEQSTPQRRILPQGSRLGEHLIIRGVLGEGGSAVVYEAFHTAMRASVAVKMLHANGSSMAGEARARLVREAHICATIADPRVPRVHGLEETVDGTPYMIMEKVNGPTLARLLRQGRMPLRRACDVAADLLEGLSVIHKSGVLHRDVKPGNLILEPQQSGELRVRLMDFGVGKLLMRSPDETSITRQGEVIGTPCYMAPEQLMGRAIDERVDVYAAGVVLFELLTGRAAYEGDSVGEVVAAVLRDDITPIRTLRPEVPAALAVVVAKATAKHPALRYATARAMRDAVIAAAKQLSGLARGRTASRPVADSECEVAEQPTQRHARVVRTPLAIGLILLGLAASPNVASGGLWRGRVRQWLASNAEFLPLSAEHRTPQEIRLFDDVRRSVLV